LKGLRETFSKINKAVDHFGTMILSVIILPRLNVDWMMCYQAIRKFYKQKCELEPNKFCKGQTIQARSHTRTGGM
jgi:hypothetical protein